jgi:hypothetical protein
VGEVWGESGGPLRFCALAKEILGSNSTGDVYSVLSGASNILEHRRHILDTPRTTEHVLDGFHFFLFPFSFLIGYSALLLDAQSNA